MSFTTPIEIPGGFRVALHTKATQQDDTVVLPPLTFKAQTPGGSAFTSVGLELSPTDPSVVFVKNTTVLAVDTLIQVIITATGPVGTPKSDTATQITLKADPRALKTFVILAADVAEPIPA